MDKEVERILYEVKLGRKYGWGKLTILYNVMRNYGWDVYDDLLWLEKAKKSGIDTSNIDEVIKFILDEEEKEARRLNRKEYIRIIKIIRDTLLGKSKVDK